MRLPFLLPAILSAAVLGCASQSVADYPRRPNPEEIADVEGIYGLSDGFRANLFGMDGRLYIRIGGGMDKELLLVGPGRFATADGDVLVQRQPPATKDRADRIAVEYSRPPHARPPIRFASGWRPGRGVLD